MAYHNFYTLRSSVLLLFSTHSGFLSKEVRQNCPSVTVLLPSCFLDVNVLPPAVPISPSRLAVYGTTCPCHNTHISDPCHTLHPHASFSLLQLTGKVYRLSGHHYQFSWTLSCQTEFLNRRSMS